MPPLDRRIDVSELGLLQKGEEWGSGVVRELRRDPRLQRKRGFEGEEPGKRVQTGQGYGGYGGYGHAGIVESVNPADGTMVISDMNGIAGFNRVGYDTVPINTSWNYIY